MADEGEHQTSVSLPLAVVLGTLLTGVAAFVVGGDVPEIQIKIGHLCGRTPDCHPHALHHTGITYA